MRNTCTSLTASMFEQLFRHFTGTSALPRLLGLLFAGIAVGAVVTADPYLATLVPEDIWSLLSLYDFPYKSTLAIAVVVFIAGVLLAFAARAREHREIQIVLLLSSMQVVAIGAGGVDPIDLLAVVMLALIFVNALSSPSASFKFPLIMYFALAIGILDLPYAITDHPAHFIVGLIKYSKSAVLALIIVHLVTSERLVRFFVKTLITVAFISASIGIAQVLLFSLTGVAYVIVDDFDDALKPTPFGMMLRAHGLNPETHTLMSFLLLAFPFSLYFATTARSTFHYILFGTVAGTIMLAIFLTWSYAGIAGVCVILGLFPMFRWPNKSIHYLLALLLLIAFLYYTDLFTVIYRMIEAEASMSTGIFQRKMLALVTIDEVSRNPWFGRGFDTVQFFSGNYWLRPVHNAYLEAWTATGPAGFIIFTSMMFIFTTNTFILGFAGSGEQEYRLRMMTLTLISFLVVMIAEPYLFSPSTWVMLGFAQALILLYGVPHLPGLGKLTRLSKSKI